MHIIESSSSSDNWFMHNVPQGATINSTLHLTLTICIIVFLRVNAILSPQNVIIFDTHPSSLMDSTVSPKMKTTKGKGIGAHSLACNTLRVEGRVGALGWGLGRLTSKSITHTDLHKLNNKLVSAQLEHLWCTDKPWANTNLQDSPWPGLGGNHHLPPYSILCAWPRG
jgi:hypothetical protein